MFEINELQEGYYEEHKTPESKKKEENNRLIEKYKKILEDDITKK